jgi:molybdenum cofactor cytidylyltransferase
MSAVQSFAVVPAAGHSRRMGRDKLKLDWASNQTVLGATLQGWLASRVDHVIVVTRHDQGDLRERHGGLPRVAFLAADPPPPEMKDSVLVALRYIADQFAPAPADVWLLAPADMPRLPSQVVNDLLAAHDVAAPRILKPTLQGKTRASRVVPLAARGARRAASRRPGHQRLVGPVRRPRPAVLRSGHFSGPGYAPRLSPPAPHVTRRTWLAARVWHGAHTAHAAQGAQFPLTGIQTACGRRP